MISTVEKLIFGLELPEFSNKGGLLYLKLSLSKCGNKCTNLTKFHPMQTKTIKLNQIPIQNE